MPKAHPFGFPAKENDALWIRGYFERERDG